MLKIVHITDTHILEKKEDTVHGIDVYSYLKKIAETIVPIKDVDCIIITGDIANFGEYDAYINVNELFENIDVHVYWLQGNHDFAEVMLQVSTKVKIKADKSFIIKDTKFILLQSVLQDEHDLPLNIGKGHLFNYELIFLKRELDENNFNHCVIALHHQPILSNTWADQRILDNREEFVNLISKYPTVKVVLYGHQHISQITQVNGIYFICSPPASYPYNPNGPMFTLFDNMQGFGIIEIDKSGKVFYEEYFI